LPDLVVPLEKNDAELRISLQACVDSVFETSRYWQDARYDEPIVPPLSSEEAGLLSKAKR
jgi:hypothetical protein